jgi:hypothetical protein
MLQALVIEPLVSYYLLNHLEFIVRVFDGDLSETKQEAMQKHQQRMIKQ